MATVGLKNLYYAPLSSDTTSAVTYGAMTKIAGAMQVDINPTSGEAPAVIYVRLINK